MSAGWGWNNFFGGNSAAKSKASTKNAILELRGTLDMLTKRERHLESQMAEQDAIARKNVSTNKTAAKAALRRKKNYETQLEQTQAQMTTIETQVASIEAANINKETYDAMRNASKAIKNIHGDLTIDKVDATMEDLREQHAIGAEIADAITSNPLGTGIDEDELENELAELQQEEIDNKMLKSGTVPVGDQIHRMPAAAVGEIPSGRHRVEEDDEEAELRKLQAEMAM